MLKRKSEKKSSPKRKKVRLPDPKVLEEPLLELIRRTSTDMSKDVEEAIRASVAREGKGSAAARALETILENISAARQLSTPVCQDTGTNIYHIWYGPNWTPAAIEKATRTATRRATSKGYLRQNVVDPLTGKNTGNNLGLANPQLHFHYWTRTNLNITLLLKGGGSENVSTQYSLPEANLKAGRDLDGVRRCVLDAVFRAQGKGCAPGVVGVGVGGDRLSSHLAAKEQLLRPLHDKSKSPALASLEKQLMEQLNNLGIGPMGFGGKTTVLAVKAGYAHRIPASFFVSVAYMCWACRRRILTVSENGSWRVR